MVFLQYGFALTQFENWENLSTKKHVIRIFKHRFLQLFDIFHLCKHVCYLTFEYEIVEYWHI